MIEATDELYKACERTIEKACFNAWRKNPIIQLDDYRSYAHEVFMDAARSFEPSKGVKFNSWLTTQLMRLMPYPRHFKMTTSSSMKSDSLVLSLDENSELFEGKACTLLDIKSPVNDGYSKRLSEPIWGLDWANRLEAFKPYLGELGEDSRVMVDDIIGGEASKKDEDGVPVPEKGRVWYSRLTPRQLYVRVYRRKGWSLERVILARSEVEKLLVKAHPKLAKFQEAIKPGIQVQEELF